MKIDLSIRQLLMLSGVLSMLLVLLMAGASLFNSMRLNEAVASANRTTEALRLQMDADMRHDAIIGGVYGALLAAERGERDSLPVKRKELSEDIDRLRQDIAELARLNLNPQVQAQLKAVEPALEEYARSALAIVDAAVQSADAVSQVGQVDQAYSGLEAPMEQMSDLIQADANVAKTRAEAVQAQNRWQIIGLLALALVVMSLGALLISQRVSAPLARLSETARRIQETGDLTLRAPTTHENEIGQTVTAFNTLIAALQSIVSEVRGNSTRILQASGTLVDMAGETTDVSQRQSEAAAAMAAAMEELSVSIDQMSDHAQAAAESSQASGRLAKEGVKIVTDVSREMREIAESVRASAQIINQLGERAARISSIVGVIKEVADQTNLLALNAAIEAARAGEQGRGFAVVADEVRKLAERTTQSTQEIAGMVADIQNGASSAVESMENGVSRVERGVRLADGAGQSMQQVAASATSVSASVADISNAIREQSVAGQEIAQRVEQVAQMSEQSHGAAEKSAAHAAHLSELARTLEAEVARFRA